MSKSVPSQPEQPEPDDVEQPAADGEVEQGPLNRAERRAKAKLTDPSHVGPRGSNVKPGTRGPRSHSKRPR